MPRKSEWFAPKRYGYGSGLPIAWQGWALLAFYAAALGFALWRAEGQPLRVIAFLVPVTIALLIVSARTTRGGWRWRWGKRD